MTLITDSESLRAVCARLSQADYVTVDTEFMRETTYWPKLCLVQLGGPDEAVAVDTMADIDLAPLYDIMTAAHVRKVFHAARQDIEIFFNLTGTVPAPLFDTQIAAMVCGFGDSVAYQTLVSRLTDGRIDKSSRFTDWSLRPLSKRQLAYALGDVTHLRTVYEKLKKKLAKSGRAHWLDEEMAVLIDPATYQTDPEEAWLRLKPRSNSRRYLAILRSVAAWREREAQARDVPRNRVLRDESLTEIAAHTPNAPEDLARTRGLSKKAAEGAFGAAILDAVAAGQAVPLDQCPEAREKNDLPRGLGPTVDLLKVLLKMKCDNHNVAPKLIAGTADLERLAADDHAAIPAMKGWRRELFGNDALALKHGRLGITVRGRQLVLVDVEDEDVARASM